jgi:phage terminase large subunit-like protein
MLPRVRRFILGRGADLFFSREGTKARRRDVVAMLFETGRACFAGVFPELEDELCAMVRGGRYAGPRSPDRADAMVWAMTELMLSPVRAEPRVRRL